MAVANWRLVTPAAMCSMGTVLEGPGSRVPSWVLQPLSGTSLLPQPSGRHAAPPSPAEGVYRAPALGREAEPSLGFAPSIQGRPRFTRLLCPWYARPALVPVTLSRYQEDPHGDTVQLCSPTPPALPQSQPHPSARMMEWRAEPGSLPTPQTIFPSRVCHPSNTVPGLACREGHTHQPKRRGCAPRGGGGGGRPSGPISARPVQSCSRWPGDGARSPTSLAAGHGRASERRGLRAGEGAAAGELPPLPALAGTPSLEHSQRWGWRLGSARWRERTGACVCVRVHEGRCAWKGGGVHGGGGCQRGWRGRGVHVHGDVCAWKGCAWGGIVRAWGLCAGCSVCAWLGGLCMHRVGECFCAWGGCA